MFKQGSIFLHLYYLIYISVTAIPYEVTIWTGSERSAGTDANIFLQMYGQAGKTESYSLRNKTDNFEQGMQDKFKV